MARKFQDAVRAVLRRFGLDIVRAVDPARQPLAADIDPQAAATIREAAPNTMTSPERLYALVQGVRYLVRAGVPGSIVECGVWRGGSMMAAARTLLECGDGARDLYLYDTYAGMPPPGAEDVDLEGHSAASLLRTQDKDDPRSVWCHATIDEVRRTLSGTCYDASRVHLVQGRVEDTIPGHAPECIALLRLDTDWYESTRHELEHLYPRLCPGGVLIIDDYGHWAGCRQAVDEYFSSRSIHLLLNRVDYSGRIALKPA